MNSTKLFNYKFLKQNLKKSSSIISFCCLIVPIINLIVFLLIGQDNDYSSITLANISTVNAILLFIIPLILSLVLFGFLLKKRSSDFVLSMPISRKEIFITNTIGGILLILAMMLINTCLLLIFSFVIPVLNISIAMVIDYFVLWFIAYVFVFTLYNLAISLSGNVVTAIVVSLLLMFLLPVILSYTDSKMMSYGYYSLTCEDDDCIPEEYLCYNDTKCLSELKNGYYHTYIDNFNRNFNGDITNRFTLPSKLFYYFFDSTNINIYNNISIIKMVFFSIVFGVLGYFALLRRNGEIAETSFNNDKIHLVVKCLTCIPLIIALFEIINENGDSVLLTIFLLVLLITYYYIYDFIVKRKVKNKLLSVGAFIFTIAIVIIYCVINDSIGINRSKSYTNKDIEGMYVIPINYRYVYPDSPKFMSTYHEDQEYIKLISKYLYSNYLNNHNDLGYSVVVNLKVSGRYFEKNINVNRADYKKIVNMTINDKYIKEYRDIDYDSIYNIRFNNQNIDRSDFSKLINLIKTSIDKIDLTSYDENSSLEDISLYLYEDHRVIIYNIPLSINDTLASYVIRLSNKKFYQDIDKNKNDHIYISSDEDKEDFNYVASSATRELLDFVKDDYKNDFDINQEYQLLYLNNDSYYTNNVNEVYDIINRKREEIKDTLEYREMFGVKDND